MSSEPIGTLLGKRKRAFLDRLSQAEDDSAPFIVIMGNEAGDTDSLASSIMLSHLLSVQDDNEYAQNLPKAATYVPLQQLPRSDLKLRAENEMLLSLLKIDASDLLYMDDLPSTLKPRKDIILGLTDHPQLSGLWHPYDDWKGKVGIVADHHADDGAHKDAKIRVLRGPENGAIGSCVSVLVDMFKKTKALEQLPSELADLALAALLIDTSDLRPVPEGKATPTDIEAGQILMQLSSLKGDNKQQFILSAIKVGGGVASEAVATTSASKDTMRSSASQYSKILSALKLDVSRLGTIDLLRRDYKEQEISETSTHLRAGFSSVPVGISDWVHERHGDGADRWDGYWKAMHDWMKQKKLDVAVVGTSFRDGGNGKHKRELLLAYKERTSASTGFSSLVKYLEEDAYASEMGNQNNLMLTVESPWKGWRRVQDTGKKERIGGLDSQGRWSGDDEMRVAVWLQRNAQASRKVYLPAIVHALKKAAKAK